jgi:hypothetical protein
LPRLARFIARLQALSPQHWPAQPSVRWSGPLQARVPVQVLAGPLVLLLVLLLE